MFAVKWDQALIEKYDTPAPRYTSYPTAVEFDENFSEDDFKIAGQKYLQRNMSVYIHIPFCHKLCYFCGCNKVVTTHKDKADIYLDYLQREIEYRAAFFQDREVSQLHLGGGTPTYLTALQSKRLMALLRDNFKLLADAEVSIEMDPRELEVSYLDHLKQLGFNRISMGIQDFNPEVQKLINREQDKELIFNLVAHARKLAFDSISVDLIYGLPKQSLDSFTATLKEINLLSPDRISVFNFAYLPQLFKAHKMIAAKDLPDANLKLQMFQQTVQYLMESGYQFIGMDHFAKKSDELAILQNNGLLHRNFQGYTTQGDTDLIGLGVSAISMLGDAYAQNKKTLISYYESVAEKQHALYRGLKLSTEDCLRRDIIKQIVCSFKLDYALYETNYQIDFKQKFSAELDELVKMQQDGLLSFHDSGFTITPTGRLLVRHIAMCFDVYSKAKQQRFSKAI